MMSPWEIGFIHRASKWQTINLKATGYTNFAEHKDSCNESENGSGYSSGDGAILQQIKMTDRIGCYGKINVNMLRPGYANYDEAKDKTITQALFEAFKSGKMLVLNSNNKELKPLIHLIPNFDVLDSCRKVFDDTIAANPKVSSFPSAREGFMKDAIMLLYNYGRFSKAEEYFKMLQKDRPEMDYGTLETFALKRTMDEIKDASYKKMMDLIDSRLHQSFFYVIMGDDDAAIANEKIAKAMYAKHQKDHFDVPRLRLPAYSKIKKEALDKFMNSTNDEIKDILKTRLKLSDKDTADDAEDINNFDLTVKNHQEKKDK
jgi:hypothetical protein